MNDHHIVEVLLVEDNPRDAELTVRALKQHNLANHLVHVKDGAEALDFLFGCGSYDGRSTDTFHRVVLLDLKLPKVNGLEVLGRMKPVVIVTSSAEDPHMEAGYMLGVSSYVVKPVQFDQFMEAMSKLGVYWLMLNRPLN